MISIGDLQLAFGRFKLYWDFSLDVMPKWSVAKETFSFFGENISILGG